MIVGSVEEGIVVEGHHIAVGCRAGEVPRKQAVVVRMVVDEIAVLNRRQAADPVALSHMLAAGPEEVG